MFNFLKNEMIVSFSREGVVFQKNEKKILLQPVLWISTGPRPIVLEVGREYYGREPAKKILIFDETIPVEMSHEYLQTFVKYGFGQSMSGLSACVRPTVRFLNSDFLRDFFPRDYRERLDAAARAAGARLVQFH